VYKVLQGKDIVDICTQGPLFYYEHTVLSGPFDTAEEAQPCPPSFQAEEVMLLHPPEFPGIPHDEYVRLATLDGKNVTLQGAGKAYAGEGYRVAWNADRYHWELWDSVGFVGESITHTASDAGGLYRTTRGARTRGYRQFHTLRHEKGWEGDFQLAPKGSRRYLGNRQLKNRMRLEFADLREMDKFLRNLSGLMSVGKKPARLRVKRRNRSVRYDRGESILDEPNAGIHSESENS